MHRDSARAKLRIEVEKIRKKVRMRRFAGCGRFRLVLQQAEVLAPFWV